MYISQWWASPIFIKNPLCTGYRYTILDRFEPGSLHWLYPTLDVDFQRRASPQLENSSEFFRLDNYKTFKIHSQLFDICLRWSILIKILIYLLIRNFLDQKSLLFHFFQRIHFSLTDVISMYLWYNSSEIYQ
jgi:hypothetical protein